MKNSLTTTRIATMLGVSGQTIANWIDQGRLRADRTPGGHRRVSPQDLMAFLAAQELSIPADLADQQHTILVVEDDPQVGPWLVAQLMRARPDLRILLAQDGYTAGELVARERPATIVLDIYLPGIDGYEVCRRIKASPETAASVVIAVTGNHTPDVQEAIIAAGAVACLAKPVAFDALISRLDQYLPVLA